MRLIVAIYCLIWPLVVMLVVNNVLMGSVRVASIAYAVGCASEMKKFVFSE
jgi:hypothetical protein